MIFFKKALEVYKKYNYIVNETIINTLLVVSLPLAYYAFYFFIKKYLIFK